MKIALLILGLFIALAGLATTIYGWYIAEVRGEVINGLAYSGPLMLVLGSWRVLSSLMLGQAPAVIRLVAVGLAFAAGYGNTALLKMTFPNDKFISTNSTQ